MLTVPHIEVVTVPKDQVVYLNHHPSSKVICRVIGDDGKTEERFEIQFPEDTGMFCRKDLVGRKITFSYDIEVGDDFVLTKKYKNLNEKETQLVVAVLRDIERELLRCYWNKNQKEMASPFMNTGNEYHCKEFDVWAYDWDEKNDVNFYYYGGDVHVYWYKHLGRGDSVTVPMNWTVDDLTYMLDDCLKGIREDFGE